MEAGELGRAMRLGRTHKVLIGLVVAGAAVIAGIGFTGSYAAVRDLALRKGFGHFAYVFPVGIDAGIVVLLALDLLLTWLRIPFPLLRQTAWLLTAATIAFNGAAAWPDALGVGMHAVIPVLFVVSVEAARHAIGRVADITADRHMESVRIARWLLSPVPTFRLWRRMKLWELRSYDEVIRREQERLVYQARLRARYGRAWRRKAPIEALMPLRLARYGVPLAQGGADLLGAVAVPAAGAPATSAVPATAAVPAEAAVPAVAPAGPAGVAVRGAGQGPPARSAEAMEYAEPAAQAGHVETRPPQPGAEAAHAEARAHEDEGMSAPGRTTAQAPAAGPGTGQFQGRRALGRRGMNGGVLSGAAEDGPVPPPGPEPRQESEQAVPPPADDDRGSQDRQTTTADQYCRVWAQHVRAFGAEPNIDQLSRLLADHGFTGRGGGAVSPSTLRRYLPEFRVYTAWEQFLDHQGFEPTADELSQVLAAQGFGGSAYTAVKLKPFLDDFPRRREALADDWADTSA